MLNSQIGKRALIMIQKVVLLSTILIVLGSCVSFSNFHKGKYLYAQEEPVEMNFETISDLIIIEGEVNGVKGRFLLDNGFSISALDDGFAKRASVTFSGTSSITDANKQKSSRPRTQLDSILIGQHKFTGTDFLRLDTKLFFPCDNIDGVIGASIMNLANWKIDFQNKTIWMAPKPFEGEGDKVKVKFSGNNSTMTKVQIRGQQYNCKIDLGSSHGISIEQDLIGESFLGEEMIMYSGIKSLSALGLGKPETSFTSVEDQKVKLGKVEMNPEHVEIKRKMKYEGYIGIDYLNEYNVIINSSKKSYWLDKVKDEEKEEHTSFGVKVYEHDGAWKVIAKNPNDPLLESIEVMDEVESIDGKSMKTFPDICAYKKYMKEKIKLKTDLRLKLKKSEVDFILPYREEVNTIFVKML